MRRLSHLLPAVAVALAACTAAGGDLATTVVPNAEEAEPAAVPVDAAPRGAPTPHRRILPRLQAGLADLLAEPTLDLDGTVGIAVVNDRGYVVLAHGADLPVLPASTQKLVTAAAALRGLGPDFRWATTLLATTSPTREGFLRGDLVLVGSGDPTLASPEYAALAYPERPRARLEELADAVAADGIRHVTGSVIGDGSYFSGPSLARGWSQGYLDDRDAAYASGLTVDGGLEVTYRDDGRAIGVATEDPARTTAEVFVRLLRARGITVAGGARSGAAPRRAREVGRVESPPLSRVLDYMVKRSDNHLADGVFLTLGAELGGRGSWTGAAAAVHAALSDLGLDWTGTVLADGSGLSRADRLTPTLLAALDRHMTRSELGDTWSGLMAVAGRTGTLRRRLRGTLADGRLLAKTGTLDDVRALAGHVVGRAGSRYHFAVVANDLHGTDRWLAYRIQDEVGLLLAEELLGCARTPKPAPSPSPSGEPSVGPFYEVECPSPAAVTSPRP
ncbi:MAG: D-alanyl-D-alanine carboxypeptidase/D-alanyl-D-alanine endopeptidase [Nitriliruptorales bacterium]